MKTMGYQRRFYRGWVKERDLYRCRVCIKESDLDIRCDIPLDTAFIKARLQKYRLAIEVYATQDSAFLKSLEPVPISPSAPAIVKEMARGACAAGVGPMAAVAGAIAQFIGKDLLRHGAAEVIVENGGDIFIKAGQPRIVGVYAGESALSRKLSFVIRPEQTPLGICASSGTVGHSLSFGIADSAVVLAKNAALADAVATATANRVKSHQDIEKAVDYARSVRGVSGAVIVLGSSFVSWGTIEFASGRKVRRAAA